MPAAPIVPLSETQHPTFYVYTNSQKQQKQKPNLSDRIYGIVRDFFVGRNAEAEAFVAGQILVELQTNFHKAPGNLFSSLLQDDIEVFKMKCKESGNIQQRDPVGACVFHIAYLYQKYEFGRWLIKEYPLHCHKPYDRPENYDGPDRFLPYTGENILHMTIAQRALEETQVILETYSEWSGGAFLSRLLDAKTTGYFFQPGGQVGEYFGELPLLFAVSSNWPEMVELILKYSSEDALWASIDSHGNNALHMCVLHGLHDMYQYIVKRAGGTHADKMEVELNKAGHSPFTLAAVTGDSSMFKYLLANRKKLCWKYGPVSRYILDLDGLDQPHGAKIESNYVQPRFTALRRFLSHANLINPFSRYKTEAQHYGAIEYMCIQDKLDMLEIPEIQEIIRIKWERVGFPQFKLRFAFYLLITVMLSLIVCLYQFQKGNTFLPWFVWCLFVSVFIILLGKLVGELPDMYKQGVSYWGYGADTGVRGAAQLDNLCSSVEFVTFGIACFLKVLQYFSVLTEEDSDGVVRIFLSITVLTAWIYLYFFLLGFEMTGVFVVIVADILSSDMPKFLSLFIIVLFGFGSSFSLLHSESGTVGLGFHDIIDTIWTLLVYTITSGNEGVQYFPYGHGSSPRWFYVGLVMLYNLCIVFLMLNLLIAMMSKTYDQLLEKSKLIVYREKYNIMCSFERGYSEAMKGRVRAQYGSIIWSQENENWKFYFQLEDTDPAWIKEKSTKQSDRVKYSTMKMENGEWKISFECFTSDEHLKEKLLLTE